MLASPKRSALLSGSLHAGAIALVLLLTNHKVPLILTELRDSGPLHYIPLVPYKSHDTGGGGGGARDTAPARRGDRPRADRRQFVPPVVNIASFMPRLPMEATILASPEAAMPIPQYGDPNGLLDNLSAGPGIKGGIGGGKGPGVGKDRGPGYGPGGDPDGGIGGKTGWKSVTTNPLLLTKIEPEYTEEARRAKLQGTVILHIDVNERGQAANIRVRQSLGLGLDERAIDAVRRWRFRPGTIDGKPSPMPAEVEVNFRLL